MTVQINPVIIRVMRPFLAGLVILSVIHVMNSGPEEANIASTPQLIIRIPAA